MRVHTGWKVLMANYMWVRPCVLRIAVCWDGCLINLGALLPSFIFGGEEYWQIMLKKRDNFNQVA